MTTSSCFLAPCFLIVDDDATFRTILAEALSERGYRTVTASHVEEALTRTRQTAPHYAILDLSMPGASGLRAIPALHSIQPELKIIILTGYAQVDTAVEAIKLGAIHYLSKPADLDEILAAFQKAGGNPDYPIITRTPSLIENEAELIRATLARNHGNISATARELNMHRRTLQRKMEKRPLAGYSD